MSNTDFRAIVAAAATQATAIAKERAMRAQEGDLQLCYREGTTESAGALLAIVKGTTVPEGYALATQDVLHGGIPYDRFFGWIYERSTRLPILQTVAN